MARAYLLLGSNLGDRAAHLAGARAALAANAGPLRAASPLYETAAWGRTDQPAYLNQALALDTELAPPALLAACLAAEQAAGRTRAERWGSRTLDVDILLIDNLVLDEPMLTVPHPRLALRRFALLPLADIAAGVVVPGLGTVAELLRGCADELAVRKVVSRRGSQR